MCSCPPPLLVPSVSFFNSVGNLENCQMVVLERNAQGKFQLVTPLIIDGEPIIVPRKPDE